MIEPIQRTPAPRQRQGELVLKITEDDGRQHDITFSYYTEDEHKHVRWMVIAMRDGLRAADFHADAYDVPRDGVEIP